MKQEIAFRQSERLARYACAHFSSPDPATPRDFTREMLQTLVGYQQTTPGYLDLERQYQPQFQELNLDQQRRGMFGFDDPEGVYHPGTLALGREGARFQREGDIRDVSELGPAAFDAFMRSNPLLARSLGNLSGRTEDSAILSLLNTQAEEGLAGGSELSPQDIRSNAQATRAAFSDRGTLHGNQAIGAELLNRDAARRQRQQAAQQFAGQVQGMNQNQNDFVGRASQIFSTTLSDPFQAILGRPSGAGGSSGGGYPQSIGTGSRLFDPTNPYAGDIYNTNFNQEAANNIAQSNAQNAQTSAIVTGVGSLLGGIFAASDKRLKKDVKRTGRKTRDGIRETTWRYKTDPLKRKFRGVIAQDAEKVRPDVVHTDPLSGIKAVNYSALLDPLELVVN